MDKKLSRQIELQVSGLHVRETTDGQRGRTIEGYAVVFGVRSVNLTPWSSVREVYEIMEPGCITNDLLNRSDVVLTAFHNNQIILGRWREGKGTLSLMLDERGLKISCTLAETATADELLTSIERGDITGMSFAFTADEEDNENGVSYERTDARTKEGKEVWLRHVKKITGLYDVAIVTHPAYEQTSVGMREASDRIDAAIEAQIKRECGGGSDDDKDKRGCGGEETDEEKAAREQAERDANGGETNAEKEAREAAEREANGGETNAEKEAREQRELEEQEQRFREQQAMRLRHRAMRLRTEQELESLSY